MITDRACCRAPLSPLPRRARAQGKDWRSLYPHVPGDPLRRTTTHTVALASRVGVALPAGDYDVGFTLLDPLAAEALAGLPDADREAHAVRFTNPARWQHGVNVVGSVRIGGVRIAGRAE